MPIGGSTEEVHSVATQLVLIAGRFLFNAFVLLSALNRILPLLSGTFYAFIFPPWTTTGFRDSSFSACCILYDGISCIPVCLNYLLAYVIEENKNLISFLDDFQFNWLKNVSLKYGTKFNTIFFFIFQLLFMKYVYICWNITLFQSHPLFDTINNSIRHTILAYVTFSIRGWKKTYIYHFNFPAFNWHGTSLRKHLLHWLQLRFNSN